MVAAGILTDSELKIARAKLIENKSQREIARELNCSESYVSKVIGKVREKAERTEDSLATLCELGLLGTAPTKSWENIDTSQAKDAALASLLASLQTHSQFRLASPTEREHAGSSVWPESYRELRSLSSRIEQIADMLEDRLSKLEGRVSSILEHITLEDRSPIQTLQEHGGYSLHERGLSTMIDSTRFDTDGAVAIRDQGMPRKGDIQATISRPSKEDSSIGLSEMERMGNKLRLDRNVVEAAGFLYTKAHMNKLSKPSVSLTVAACLYVAARQLFAGVQLQELVDASGHPLTKKAISRRVRELQVELGFHLPQGLRTVDYISRIATDLKLDPAVEKRALNIVASGIRSNKISGFNPIGIASAALYLAATRSEVKLDLRQLATTYHVSPETIRKHSKTLDVLPEVAL